MDRWNMNRRAGIRRMAGAAAALSSLGGLSAWAQPAAGKSVRWIVPYPAGGGSDFVARTVASGIQGFSDSIIIDNKPGGNGAVAIADLKRSPSDGLTWVNVDNGIMVFNPALYSKLGYDPVNDLRLITMFGAAPMVLTVGPAAGVSTAVELVDKIKANPGKLGYGSAGAGGPQHMAAEMLLRAVGGSAIHAPYRGSNPALSDLAGGQIPFLFTDFPAARGFIESGKLRPLAVAHKTRLAQLPDVPTLAEVGIRDVELAAWTAATVRAGTPDAMVEAAYQAIRASLARPAVSEKLLNVGIELVEIDRKQQEEQVRAEQEKYGQLIKELKISLD